MRKDYTVGLAISETGARRSRPEVLRELSLRRRTQFTGYCSPEFDRLIEEQSTEADTEKRRKLVWQIERRLAEEVARPVIFYTRGGTCSHPGSRGSR